MGLSDWTAGVPACNAGSSGVITSNSTPLIFSVLKADRLQSGRLRSGLSVRYTS